VRALRNERGVILDWLAKTVLLLALFGVLVFDGASVAVNFLGLSSTADDIAAAVSTDVTGASITDSNAVEEEAKLLAREAGARLVSAELDIQGIVHIKVRRRATTLVLGRVPATEKWTKAIATARATTNTN
jgi:hypothetical protein